MKYTQAFNFIILLILLSNCNNKKNSATDDIINNQSEIKALLTHFKTSEQIDTLISFGLYNLAFEAISINENYFNDQDKIKIANQFVDNGEFDKGLELAKSINQSTNYYDLIHLKLNCALNKQDTLLSGLLLDSLSSDPTIKANTEKQISFNLLKAYHAHNSKQYYTSIALNEKALNDIQLFHLPTKYLIKAYRRIGNDYNDIVRDKIPFNKSALYCFNKGMEYYQKELDLLLQASNRNQAKIALNYITSAMLMSNFDRKYDVIPYYHKALQSLIVANKNDFIITRNPIYTSIAFSQIAYFLPNESERDSMLNLNQALINVRSFYKVNEHQSLDIIEYFPQRSQEIKILNELDQQMNRQSIRQILSLSNYWKYPNQFLYKNLQNQFGDQASLAVKNWILLNELFVFGTQSNNYSTLNFAGNLLREYDFHIKKVMAQKNVAVNEKNITALKQFCQSKHSTILDFQKLFNGTLLIIKIDENGMILNKLDKEKAVSDLDVTHLIDAINSNNLQQFAVIANSIYGKLDLGSIQTKNIIICPDEFLEKLPFDALAQISNKPTLWSDIEYIGKTKNIQLIPNIQSLVQTAEIEAKLKVDIWSSELANATLPYNELLIRYLEEDLAANTNQADPMNVLHILAHTNRTAENNIEFLLDNDTITIDNNGCKSPILTILEGCSSGDGKILKSEGSLSLTRSFLYKNTPTVIYSIWDADNHSSSILFKHFYAYLLQGIKTSEALYRSKNDLINDHLHPEWASPYYWANYQITGKNILFTH
jgi:hypothetical protein